MLGFGWIPIGSLDRVGGGTLSVFVLFQVVILMISSFLQTLKVKNPLSSSMHNLESRFHFPDELILIPEIDVRAFLSVRVVHAKVPIICLRPTGIYYLHVVDIG